MENGTDTRCQRCGVGDVVAYVCYSACNRCSYQTPLRPGSQRFQDLDDGESFRSGYDRLADAVVFIKSSPPPYLPEDLVEFNAYAVDHTRRIWLAPDAAVMKYNPLSPRSQPHE